MKKIAVVLILIVTGCAGWTFNGLDLSRIDTPEAALKATAGVATSFLVHFAGHAIYLEASGIDWRLDGTSEVIEEPIPNTQKQWVGRAGFVAQLAVGLSAQTLFDTSKSAFWQGYHIGSAFQVIAYPLVCPDERDSDLGLIDSAGGKADAEYAAYSLLSIYLLK